ncbi:TatD family hydrolase [Alkalisalibacterium limincola]|uniref:TatD family deoxyribonuclease n=1 Tax=Alkalisalibacterium limincola TaxID=2699169 RepID=A0A5C8KV91_9GAMM|nr:TatD family hydrolase [Alkalisalibacterium limincola]TXK65639.1 TatD family deoxyribonuclease [Alkalisalibacterium limincola]
MDLIDSHCHLDLEAFDADRDDAIARARDAGIGEFVVPAVSRRRWAGLEQLCARNERLHPAYGMHPMFMDEHAEGDLAALSDWLDDHAAVAVGECGLDFHAGDEDRDAQCMLFEGQLEIARERELPVIIHARKSVEDVIIAIRRVGGLRGVVHSFPGSFEQARQLWDNGFLVSLGGPLTYERARKLRRLVAEIPLEWLMLETDSPDQPLCGHQGERNEPVYLRKVLAVVAGLRGVDEAVVAAATSANARELFALPDRRA